MIRLMCAECHRKQSATDSCESKGGWWLCACNKYTICYPCTCNQGVGT